jgi:tetratricopeptide (TPR) repeat protein
VTAATEQVLEHARRAGNRRKEREALMLLGPSLFWGPTPSSEALPRAEAIAESARGDKWVEAWAFRPLAGFYARQGRFEEARELLARARANLEELGRTLDVSTLAFWTGPLEVLAGNPETAERELRAGCAALEAAGEKGWLSTMAGVHARVLCALDRVEEAEAAARLSREAATSDDYNAQSIWRHAEAVVLARRGRFEEAESLAREAVTMAERNDELENHAEVRMGLVEVLWRAGKRDDALATLAEALALYEQKGNPVMIERARALLDELSGAEA